VSEREHDGAPPAQGWAPEVCGAYVRIDGIAWVRHDAVAILIECAAEGTRLHGRLADNDDGLWSPAAPTAPLVALALARRNEREGA
jgi:hypothetical protein